MKYEVKPWPTDPAFWYVAQGDIPRFSRRMTESEAHIIAWALNAVAEGKTLAMMPAPDAPWFEPYSGPTDGVAPQ